ncbi:MAG: hypothetical protein M0T85_15710 [Dehalococcoidales bacterium]|nr:hypothetical protein [Dehalococcoidales bacterium]
MINYCRCGHPILIVEFFGPDGSETQFWSLGGPNVAQRVTHCPTCGDEIREHSLLPARRPALAAV